MKPCQADSNTYMHTHYSLLVNLNKTDLLHNMVLFTGTSAPFVAI